PWAAAALLLAGASLLLAWHLLWSRHAGETARIATAAQARHTVAVLPLVDETGRPDLAWTSAGIAESLASTLAESPSLEVINSVRVFRSLADLNLVPATLGSTETRQLGELLDADRLVTGHVRLLGDRILVDVAMWTAGGVPAPPSATHVQSGAITDLPRVVVQLGDALRQEMEIAAPPEPLAPAAVPAAAIEAYGSGVAFLARGDFVHAAPLFERAVRVDAAFAAAWARLADADHNLGFDERAREAASRASTILQGSNSRIALEARAREASLAGDPETAQKTLEALLRHYPNDAEAHITLAESLAQQGKLPAALGTLREIVQREPNHPRAWYL
ncbi:MAG: hypothetical protein B7Z74_10945, partial [Deltaproteobacteria bacterium 21-66-5]